MDKDNVFLQNSDYHRSDLVLSIQLITLIPREGTETQRVSNSISRLMSVDYPYPPRGDFIDANQLTLVLLRRNRRAFCVYCLLLCRRAIPSMARLILRKGRLRDRQT